jgi:DDE superfamily endonuclease
MGVPDAVGGGPVDPSGVGLAVPFGLGPPERYCQERGKRHKKITEWAWQMLLRLRRWQPHREIIAVADGGYASLKLLDRCRSLSRPITFITRLRLDAALYEPAPPRYPGQIGRPRLKGERLPNLSAVLEDPKTAWTPIRVSGWYGGGERSVEVVSETAVWYSTGLPAVVLRWVLIRDPRSAKSSRARLCYAPTPQPIRLGSSGGL